MIWEDHKPPSAIYRDGRCCMGRYLSVGAVRERPMPKGWALHEAPLQGRIVGIGPCACPHFVFDHHSGVNLDQCGINYRHSCASRNPEPMRLLVRSYFFPFEVSRITPLRVGLLLFGKTDGEVRAQACKRAGEGSAPTEEGGAAFFVKADPYVRPLFFPSLSNRSLFGRD